MVGILCGWYFVWLKLFSFSALLRQNWMVQECVLVWQRERMLVRPRESVAREARNTLYLLGVACWFEYPLGYVDKFNLI